MPFRTGQVKFHEGKWKTSRTSAPEMHFIGESTHWREGGVPCTRFDCSRPSDAFRKTHVRTDAGVLVHAPNREVDIQRHRPRSQTMHSDTADLLPVPLALLLTSVFPSQASPPARRLSISPFTMLCVRAAPAPKGWTTTQEGQTNVQQSGRRLANVQVVSARKTHLLRPDLPCGFHISSFMNRPCTSAVPFPHHDILRDAPSPGCKFRERT